MPISWNLGLVGTDVNHSQYNIRIKGSCTHLNVIYLDFHYECILTQESNNRFVVIVCINDAPICTKWSKQLDMGTAYRSRSVTLDPDEREIGLSGDMMLFQFSPNFMLCASLE